MSTTHRDKWRAETLPETPLWTLAFDGSCPGNPGPMGIGYTIGRAGYPPLIRVGAQIGEGTNNIAEYTALVHGMRTALRFGMYKLRIVSDSMLVVRQYGRQWRVRDGTLGKWLRWAHLYALCFAAEPRMFHVPREDNAEADLLSRSLEFVAPRLDAPRPGRAILGWQAAALNVWWHSHHVRSGGPLGRIYDIQETQVDQIVQGKSYSDATFEGHPVYTAGWLQLRPLVPPPLSAGEFVQETAT